MSMGEYHEGMKTSLSQYTAGACVIAFGTLLLLDRLHITDNALGMWWPLLLIVIGIVMLVSDRRNLWGIALIVGGGLFQLRALEMIDINPWEFFWPVIIILVGLSIILNRSRRPEVSARQSDDASAIFGGVDLMSASEDYQGGNATAVLGGVKIDMRKAIIKKEATLTVFVLCGGIELIVPEGVVVKPQATCILGGIENKYPATATKNAPVLYVAGTVTMGGIEIKH